MALTIILVLIFEHIVGMIFSYRLLSDGEEGTLTTRQVLGYLLFATVWPVLWTITYMVEWRDARRSKLLKKMEDEKKALKGTEKNISTDAGNAGDQRVSQDGHNWITVTEAGDD